LNSDPIEVFWEFKSKVKDDYRHPFNPPLVLLPAFPAEICLILPLYLEDYFLKSRTEKFR
jgi:hypothetical protein